MEKAFWPGFHICLNPDGIFLYLQLDLLTLEFPQRFKSKSIVDGQQG